MSSGCFYCGNGEAEKCPTCSKVLYCLKHKNIHTSKAEEGEERECFPFEISSCEGVGRYLVASRTIEAGELILKDTAAVIAPSSVKKVCVTCLTPCNTSCPGCYLPLCCSSEEHQEECQIFSKVRASWPISSYYLALAVYRLLGMSDEQEERVERLMDHLEERRRERSWAVMDSIAEQLTGAGVTNCSKERMERLAGIILTNCLSCGKDVDGVEHGIGLFPVFSILSHSCVSNTLTYVEDRTLFIRASTRIEEGEEILGSYKNPSLGSISRRNHFITSWYFDCSCKRCADPTELGTYLSALRCRNCEKGYHLATHPLAYNSPWRCENCLHTLSSVEAMNRTVAIFKQAKFAAVDVDSQLEMLAQLQVQLHNNHYICNIVKKNIVNLIQDEDASLERLEVKVRLCEEQLAVLEVIEPGISSCKGKLMEAELGAIVRIVRLTRNNLGSVGTFLLVKKVMFLMREAGKHKQFEARTSQEAFRQRVNKLSLQLAME